MKRRKKQYYKKAIEDKLDVMKEMMARQKEKVIEKQKKFYESMEDLTIERIR